MKDFLTQRFLETYAPDGLDVYIDEVHEPQLVHVHRKRMASWLELVLLFFALTSFRHSPHAAQVDAPITTKQRMKDVLLNLIGYQDSGPIWWQWINAILMVPTFLYHVAVIPFHITMNAIKLFTELLPRIGTVILFRFASYLENQPTSRMLSRACLLTAALFARALACVFSTLRFVSRALTSPLDGIYVGWRIGNALGGTAIGTDEEGNCKLVYTNTGRIFGGALAGLSGLITLSTFIITLPLILWHYEIYLSDNVINYIPAFVFDMMDLLDPIINAMAYFLGWDRVIAILDLHKEAVMKELCFMRLLEPLAHELMSPHLRNKIKDALVLLVGGVAALFANAANTTANKSAAFISTFANLMGTKLPAQASVVTPSAKAASASVVHSPRLFSSRKPRFGDDKVIAEQDHIRHADNHKRARRQMSRVSL